MQQLQIPYSVGRKNLGKVKNVVQAWSTVIKRFQTPTQTKESFKDYLKLSRDEKNKLKNVDGYFFAAQCEGGSRKREAVKARALLTLDLDANAVKIMSEINMGLSGISGYEFFTHGTRSHTEKDPSLRIVIPLARMIEPDEHAPLSRIVSSWVDPTMRSIDPITHRLAQMMYLPSVSRDSDYYFMYNEGDLLDPDDIIAKWESEHGDDALHNLDLLPKNPDLEGDLRDSHVKAEWPLDKTGIVGQWCRAYEDIETVIEVWLQDYYEPADHSGTDVRYIPVGSSGGAGAIIYDGQWMYSNHTTDPCAGQLVNSFDIVRLCKFGDQDPDDIRDIKVTDLPSWGAMTDFAEEDKRCVDQGKSERYGMIGQLSDDDEDTSEPDTEADSESDVDRMLGLLGGEESGDTPKQQSVDEVDPNWTSELELTKGGKIIANLDNTGLVSQNDKRIRGLWAKNELSGLIMQVRDLDTKIPELANIPLRSSSPTEWSEEGDAIISLMIARSNMREVGKGYGFKPSKDDLQIAIINEALRRKFHPIIDRLNSFDLWDGVERMNTVFHRYLHTPDDKYYGDVFELALIASIARVKEPGCKYDVMPVLEGLTGTRKSTFIKEIGMGFFLEFNTDVSDAQKIIENTQTAWVLELGEMDTYSRSQVESFKQFMSCQVDRARPAYGRRALSVPRQFTMWGTTNKHEYLRDETGNRRIFPVRLGDDLDMFNPIDIDAFRLELPLLYAEALFKYHEMRKAQPDMAVDLFLDLQDPESVRTANGLTISAMQESSESELAGRIDEYYADPVPLSVVTGSTDEQGMDDVQVERTVICCRHVYDHLMSGSGRAMQQRETLMIARALELCSRFSKTARPGGKPPRRRFKYGGYGQQTAYYLTDKDDRVVTAQEKDQEYRIVADGEFSDLI